MEDEVGRAEGNQDAAAESTAQRKRIQPDSSGATEVAQSAKQRLAAFSMS